MTALHLTHTKEFMGQLLKTNLFDDFLLSEALIRAGGAYHIDGHIQPDYYSEEDKEELGLNGLLYLPYAMLRQICFDLIKGKRTPSFCRFIFLLTQKQTQSACGAMGVSTDAIKGLCINICYQNGQLTLTGGISYGTFCADHDAENGWDGLVQAFLTDRGVAWEPY